MTIKFMTRFLENKSTLNYLSICHWQTSRTSNMAAEKYLPNIFLPVTAQIHYITKLNWFNNIFFSTRERQLFQKCLVCLSNFSPIHDRLPFEIFILIKPHQTWNNTGYIYLFYFNNLDKEEMFQLAARVSTISLSCTCLFRHVWTLFYNGLF